MKYLGLPAFAFVNYAHRLGRNVNVWLPELPGLPKHHQATCNCRGAGGPSLPRAQSGSNLLYWQCPGRLAVPWSAPGPIPDPKRGAGPGTSMSL